MDKEELKKEAEEKAKKRTKGFKCQDNCEKSYVMGALDFAEPREKRIAEVEKENAELRAIAENQQSSNMSRYFENKKLKEGLAVGSTLNKGLNSLNKTLEEERDKYRNMVFDKDGQLTKADEQLTKAKEIIKLLLWDLRNKEFVPLIDVNRAEQFINGESCPDCLCKDCTKDCGIKKLGLVEAEK